MRKRPQGHRGSEMLRTTTKRFKGNGVGRFIGLWLMAASFLAPGWAGAAGDLSEADIKRLALEAILENPDIIMQAVAILRERDAAEAASATAETLSSQRELLERDPNAPVIGNPEGDVTIVEFFDYNCPYCKRVAPEVAALLDEDTNVRVVYREWPILSPGSVVAARAALASRTQGKYAEFHEALMELRGRADEASVMQVAKKIGLNIDQLKADMQAPEIDEHLQTTVALAKQLGFNGTPSFVIGDSMAPGFIELDQLKQMVAGARDN